MSTFAQRANARGTLPPFADRKQLASDGTRFCVSEVKLVHQSDGKERWYLTIHLRDGDGEYVKQTLTYDRTTSRDEEMEDLQGELPQHNMFLELLPLKKNGKPTGQTRYYNRCDTYAVCECGLVDEEEEDADGDEDEEDTEEEEVDDEVSV